MSKKKLNLEELKVQSFITSLEGKKAHTIRGGEGDLDPTNEGEGSDCCGPGTGLGCTNGCPPPPNSDGCPPQTNGCPPTNNNCTDGACGGGATDDGGDGCGSEVGCDPWDWTVGGNTQCAECG